MPDEERNRIYSIPDNFIDESRIVKGMFKTRNFIEGLIMALIAAVPAMLIPAGSINSRVMILVAICGPFFLLGNVGFNGDPISTTLKNAVNWIKTRCVMLYNSSSRPLKESPLDNMFNTGDPRDKIVDMIDAFKEGRRRKAATEVFIEGETFVFEDDPELTALYADESFSPEITDTVNVSDAAKNKFAAGHKNASAPATERDPENKVRDEEDKVSHMPVDIDIANIPDVPDSVSEEKDAFDLVPAIDLDIEF